MKIYKIGHSCFVLEEGVVEEGKHENLIKIKGGIYRKLYELHIGLA